jgi:DNA-binding CsgD family transcriptional regulator
MDSESTTSFVSDNDKKVNARGVLKPKRVVLICIGSFLFPFLYGLIAEIFSNAGINEGLFDERSELIAIGALLLLTIGLFVGKRQINVLVGFVAMLPLYATAFLIFHLCGDEALFLVGILIKCGYLLYFTLGVILAVQEAHRAPTHAFFFLGLIGGTQYLSVLVGRGFGFVLYAQLDFDSVFTVAIALSAWILILAATVFIALLFPSMGTTNPMVIENESPIAEDVLWSSFSLKCQMFVTQYSLSEREAEVLHEFIRGRNLEYIAKKHFLSRETVKTYLKRIYTKANLHSRQELFNRVEQIEIK